MIIQYKVRGGQPQRPVNFIKVWVSEKCSKKYSKKHSKNFYLLKKGLKKVNALF